MSVEHCPLARSIEAGRIKRTGQVGEEHPAALQVQRDANGFHQVGDQDVRGGAGLPNHIHRGAVHRVTARRIASVGPVQETVLEIELQIDRLGQTIEKDFDVRAIGGALPLGNFDAGALRCAMFRRARDDIRWILAAPLCELRLPIIGQRGFFQTSRRPLVSVCSWISFKYQSTCPWKWML